MPFVELAAQHAAGTQGARGELEKATEHVEAVGAAVQRELGLVVLDLGGDLLGEHRSGDVGRVAHQHGEGAGERGVDPGGEVALHELDRVGEPERIAVARGEVDGRGREVRGHDPRASPLVGDGKRDAARAAPHLQHTARQPAGSVGGRVHTLERGVYQNLRLWTGDEDALLALKDDVAEGRLAGDVLQGLARGSPAHGVPHASPLVARERAVVVHVKLHAGEAHDVAQQPLGREPRMLVSAAGKEPAGPVNDLLDCPGFLVVSGIGGHCASPLFGMCYRIIANVRGFFGVAPDEGLSSGNCDPTAAPPRQGRLSSPAALTVCKNVGCRGPNPVTRFASCSVRPLHARTRHPKA